MNTIIIETLVLGLLFTLMVYKMSRNPIKEIYNYPLKIQERVKSLKQNADKIVVLKDGKVAEIGKPKDLLLKNSIFKEMVNKQKTSLEWNIN